MSSINSLYDITKIAVLKLFFDKILSTNFKFPLKILETNLSIFLYLISSKLLLSTLSLFENFKDFSNKFKKTKESILLPVKNMHL